MVLTKTPICNFGEKPHSFSLKGVDEKIYKLEDCLGKNGTIIMFICNHCPYVKAIIKNIVEDTNKLKELNIKAVAIMSNDTINYPEDSFEKMKEFSKLNNFNFPYVIDTSQEIAKKYGAVCTPDEGKCVSGPCIGASLQSINVFEEKGYIYFVQINEWL